ncbi:MAG: response regulator [Kiritimatiellae bacterium]|nr:response regulator [Kiritimatiellia bacterium]MDD5521478.1 response regulator [Kiritimatiellia bacterium]
MENQGKRKILLVDDDTSLLVTLSDFLRYEGYDVITAESGEQALKKLQQIVPDLIILDMSMPGMGGVGFLRNISSEEGKPNYPVLVLTARANMAEFFANVDIDGFVPKPCPPSDLLMEVGRILFLRGSNKGESVESHGTGKNRVLIGDDDTLCNQAICDIFIEAGYIVDSVLKGPEVLEKAIVGKPDVVVMKVVFAGMNGDAIVKMMKEMPHTKDIPVVLYDNGESQIPDAEYTQAGAGVVKFVRSNKPDLLLSAVKEILKV